MDLATKNELQKLYDANGYLKPSLVLKKAENKRSELHKHFEWDDSKASHNYRLIQARKLIRKVTIVFEEKENRMVHVPSIIREGKMGPGPDEGVYKPITAVVRTIGDFELAYNEALSKLLSAKQAVHELDRAAGEEKDDVQLKVSLILKSLETIEESFRTIHA